MAEQEGSYLTELKKILESGDITEKEAHQYIRQKNIKAYLESIPKAIFNRYTHLIQRTSILCPHGWHNQLIYSEYDLKAACYEIQNDLQIILARRENLIGRDKDGSPLMSRGKIAGTTTFLLAGARMVQVGSATFAHPAVMIEIIRGIEEYMRNQGVKTLAELSIRKDFV
jgi:hypothetical protein